MQLYIDTTVQGLIKLEIKDGAKILSSSQKKTLKISESILPAIEKLLTKTGIEFSQISKVAVNAGPGGFSSTRTGVAIANALNFALGNHTIVMPKYDKEPNISHPKK